MKSRSLVAVGWEVRYHSLLADKEMEVRESSQVTALYVGELGFLP